MRRPAILRCSMSLCTLAIRPRRSSAEIGLASAVMDFNSAPDALGSTPRAPIASSDAPAAPLKNTRLDSMVIPFVVRGAQRILQIATIATPRRTMRTIKRGGWLDVQAVWTAGIRFTRRADRTRGDRRSLRAHLGGQRSGRRGELPRDQSHRPGAGIDAAGRHRDVRVGRDVDPPRAESP